MTQNEGDLFARPMSVGTLKIFMETHLEWTTDRFASHVTPRPISARVDHNGGRIISSPDAL